ncbi:alpha/beta hydrolase [Bythopirellula polymerisocia]|uniref:Carbohydrate acetyl esterase/feruloyl esterase n=1 Tax=Bythopirellula polymerisocia TaxID=2528003 RepID=A0A5C6D188_9BACT|nr:alpha/beta hydrolase-fold protein [Bythopirellula polymerisocia]TWU29955.1 Carbohydrate acetyl esterase/feruloyl esterase precursor [Bythopirellula polymerisocia]
MQFRIIKFSACLILVSLGVATPLMLHAQAPPNPNYVRQQLYPSYQDFKNDLLAKVGIADPTQRTAELNSLWSNLKTAGQVPYAQDGKVAFLYRGNSSTVAWPGDFNSWNPSASWQGTQFAGTDMWILEKTFPNDARLDYKVVLNGSNWILDPANPLQMWSGFGPNNELRMPEYIFPQETVRVAGVPQGTLTNNITTFSTKLGYSVNHRVYTPAGYASQSLSDLPVVYVTDGHEYLADHMGSMVVVLDNLIASGALQPTMAVFIDPRDPTSGQNRRAEQYTGNASFAGFVADELVPMIDAAYRTQAQPAGRTILGTSLGGVNSAYFGATRSDVFQHIAIQSPASFSNIFNLYATQSLQDKVDLFITAGTIGDGSGGTTFTNLLKTHSYDYSFLQTSEGHSWGNWRGLLDDILIDLVGPTASGDFDHDGDVDGRDFLEWQRKLSAGSLSDWQTQYGSNLPLTAVGIAIPEPTTAVLSLIATASHFLSRRNNRH